MSVPALHLRPAWALLDEHHRKVEHLHLRQLFAEDRERGHMTVVAQMVAGSAARTQLKPALVARMEPWIALCEEAIEKGLGWLGLPEIVPRRELAYAFVTFYLGVNLMTQLDEDHARTDALFERLELVAPLLGSFGLGTATDG